MRLRNLFLMESFAEGAGAMFRAWERAEAKAVGRGRLPLVVVDSGDREKGRLVLIHEADLGRLPSSLYDVA